jgi:hypothetical protein
MLSGPTTILSKAREAILIRQTSYGAEERRQKPHELCDYN